MLLLWDVTIFQYGCATDFAQSYHMFPSFELGCVERLTRSWEHQVDRVVTSLFGSIRFSSSIRIECKFELCWKPILSWKRSVRIEADSFALPHVFPSGAQPFGHFLHSLHRAEVEKTIVVEQQRKKSFLFSFEVIFVGPSTADENGHKMQVDYYWTVSSTVHWRKCPLVNLRPL